MENKRNNLFILLEVLFFNYYFILLNINEKESPVIYLLKMLLRHVNNFYEQIDE